LEAVEKAKTPDASRVWAIGAHLVAGALLVVAFWALFSFGTRYGFEKGVEYWLFRPSDNVPIVILGLSAWLAYRRSHRLRALPRRTGPWWLIVPLLVLGMGVYTWAIYTTAQDLLALSLIANLMAFVLVYWGLPGLRVLWLPIVFLLFAIPMPAPLLLAVVFKMQIWTADYAGWILHAAGVPALVSGDQILRATQAFQVIEGCSGLRSLETLTMLTVLMIDLFGRRSWHAVVLVVAAPLVAFALNGFRVVTLILNPHSEVIAIHNLQGIAILLLGLLLVYGLDGLLERLPLDRALKPQPEPRGVQAISLPGAAALVAVVAAVLVGIGQRAPIWQSQGADRRMAGTVGRALDGWESRKLDPDFIFRGSARFGQVSLRRYEHAGAPVDVFVGTADFGQRGGSPLSPTTALPGTGWTVRESGQQPVGPGGRDVEVRLLEKGKTRVLVRHWYEGAKWLGVEALRSLMALDRSGLKRSDPLLAVRLSTPVANRSEQARRDAEARLAEVQLRLEPALREIMDGA
jgi:EpsI family protein